MKTKFESLGAAVLLLASFFGVLIAVINNNGEQFSGIPILLNSLLINWLVFKRVTE